MTGHANLIEAHMDAQNRVAGPENAIAVSGARGEAVRAALYANGLPGTVTVNVGLRDSHPR